MNTAEFLGYRYDEDKLIKYEEDIAERKDTAYGHISDMEYADELNGKLPKQYSVCACCGRTLVHSYFGYGVKCAEQLFRSIGIMKKISPEFNELMTSYTLNKWNAYATTIRYLYIKINSDDNGELKKFRSSFKKSFVPAIMQADRISRKQVDVMINDIRTAYHYGNTDKIDGDTYDMLNKQMDIIKRYRPIKYNELLEQFDDILHTNDIVKFVRITYKNAWIDNPFNSQSEY